MEILMYFIIFFAKMVEVCLTTVRNVLIVRGEKGKGAFLAFFECLVWLLLISNVLQNITEDPIKMIAYCSAFALGNYCGVIIEGKLAIGMACIQVVVGAGQTGEVSRQMRSQGFGVTTLLGEGKDGPVNVMMIFLKRKCQKEAIQLIKTSCPNALITVNDVRHMRNGFLK